MCHLYYQSILLLFPIREQGDLSVRLSTILFPSNYHIKLLETLVLLFFRSSVL